jgi:hypothetical protein
MTNLKIDDKALQTIMKNPDVKITVQGDIPEYYIKYLTEELKELKVSEETLSSLKIIKKYKE